MKLDISGEAVAEGEWEPREQMWGLERHQGQVINTPYLFCKRAQVSSVQSVPISELLLCQLQC